MSLLRNVLTVGGATLVSRVAGFLRDTGLAAVLGSGPAADAFLVALRLPNLFRRLFAEGAFAAAFVPVHVRRRAEAGEAAARRFTGEALAGLVVVVVVVTLVAMLVAPQLVDLLAPGFAADPGKRDLTIRLARICLPYLALVTVVALVSGPMIADRRFLVPSLAPVVLNAGLIAALLFILVAGGFDHDRAAILLAWAVVAGGVAQVALLAVAVVRAGLAPPLVAPRLSPEIRRLVRLGLPGLLGGAISEINLIVGTVIASATTGAVSWLYYADRLYQLPLGVVGIAVGQVLLPEIAHRLGEGGPDAGRDVQNRALEFALALALPAALALALLAEPIVSVLFERGAFTAADRLAAARALEIFAFGLPAFVLVRVFTPVFQAREDTMTPMLIGGVAVAVNAALALAFAPVIGWLAVALATVAAGWVNAVMLLIRLRTRRLWHFDAVLVRRLPRLAVAALAMAVVVHLAHGLVEPWLALGRSALVRSGTLAGLVGLGVAVHAGLIFATGVVDGARPRFFRRREGDRHHDASCPRPEDRA
ncbi:MAG: murein biosynthesis integral membrane protein MurJ [Siculibacillus sp.]|nr:murein biosynthesis integral membrane protein MurJ [Siculibacillus sp.]